MAVLKKRPIAILPPECHCSKQQQYGLLWLSVETLVGDFLLLMLVKILPRFIGAPTPNLETKKIEIATY